MTIRLHSQTGHSIHQVIASPKRVCFKNRFAGHWPSLAPWHLTRKVSFINSHSITSLSATIETSPSNWGREVLNIYHNTAWTNKTWTQGDLDVVYVQKQKSNRGGNENTIQQLCVAEKRQTSSAWNSVETTGQVVKKQPLCITGQEGWLCWGGKWWRIWSIKSGLPSVVETHQLYLRLPFPTVERRKVI